MSEPRIGYIYKATNIENGHSYIGQTVGFKNRKGQHIYSALNNKSDTVFSRAIRKYGKESFRWTILFEGRCHKNKLNSLEIFFIAYYDTQTPNGYNVTRGGDGIIGIPTKIRKRAGKRQTKTLSTVNPKTGLTRKQEIEVKRLHTIMQIDTASGMTIAKLNNGQSVRVALNRIDPKTGMSIAQERAKRAAATMMKIDEKTGISIYNATGRKVSSKLKARYKNRSLKNSRSKKYLLIAPNGQLIGAWGNLKMVCKKYGLNLSRMQKFVDGGRIPISVYKNNKSACQCEDWRIFIVTHCSRYIQEQ